MTIDDPYPRGDLGPIPRLLVGMPDVYTAPEQSAPVPSFESLFVAVLMAEAREHAAASGHRKRGRSRKRGSPW